LAVFFSFVVRLGPLFGLAELEHPASASPTCGNRYPSFLLFGVPIVNNVRTLIMSRNSALSFFPPTFSSIFVLVLLISPTPATKFQRPTFWSNGNWDS
jgi:hypothetical protein